jgi:carbonic anhydrase
MQLIVEENVRLQLEHLLEYPFVSTAIREEKLTVHGWVYDMETGTIKVLQRNLVACQD